MYLRARHTNIRIFLRLDVHTKTHICIRHLQQRPRWNASTKPVIEPKPLLQFHSNIGSKLSNTSARADTGRSRYCKNGPAIPSNQIRIKNQAPSFLGNKRRPVKIRPNSWARRHKEDASTTPADASDRYVRTSIVEDESGPVIDVCRMLLCKHSHVILTSNLLVAPCAPSVCRSERGSRTW